MEQRKKNTRVDREGIRTTEKNRRGDTVAYAICAGAIAALTFAAAVELGIDRTQVEVASPAKERPEVRVATGHAPRAVAPRTETRDEPPAVRTTPAESATAAKAREMLAQVPESLSQEPAREVSEKEAADMAGLAEEMVKMAVADGETRGIAAFPAPGTNPIKLGLVVPKNFDLPEGYIRHYQLTDDGRKLEPILMFSPDYEFVDANGQPWTPPADGIVPEDMAPQGLPLRTLPMPKHPYGASLTAR